MPGLVGCRQWSPAAHGAVSILFNGDLRDRGGNSHDMMVRPTKTYLPLLGIGRSRKLSENKTKNRPRPAKISRTNFRSQERTAFRNGVSKFDNLEPKQKIVKEI